MFKYATDSANQSPRCKQRGIKLVALQSSGVFDPRGTRQISMQAWLPGSLLAGIKEIKTTVEIRYDKAAVKYLQGLPEKLRDSIRSAITGLLEQPPKGDIKPMQGYKDGRRRLRVGKYIVTHKTVN